MDPMTSFLMALAALLLTVGNMVLTAVNFRKSAGSVVVQMNATLLNPGRSSLTNDKGTFGLDTLTYDRSGIELAKVVIENPGRTAATVTKVAIRIEGAKDPDLAMTVRPIEIRHLGGVSAVTDSTYRLEPFDQVIYLLDFWSVVNYVFAEDPQLRRVNIWASVKVAGQDNPYDSKNHGYWTIRREWVSLIAPYTKRTARSIILAEMMNVVDDPGHNPYLTELSVLLEERISQSASAFDITETFQKVLGPGSEHREILGPLDAWTFLQFGWNVKSRLDALGQQVVWPVLHGDN